MKRITLLFVWACCMYAYTTHGQTLEIETDDQSTIEARIEYALSSLDLSPVTTHILKDRTVPMGRLGDYYERSLEDSIYTSMDLLDLHYSSLYAAKIPGNNLIDPETLYRVDWTGYTPSSTIPLNLLAMEYHQFRPDAVDQGILTFCFIHSTIA